MNARRSLPGALLLLATSLSASSASALSVEISTDRGKDAVYKIGDPLAINARVSDNANLIVYEIDAEGYVHLLFPDRDSSPLVQGERNYELPAPDSNLELVVRGPVGQGYIVAIASYVDFLDLPWYLKPYDAQAEEMGYEGEPDEEQGVTAEGRIVGDPFVAMERIRRRVLADPEDEMLFASAYTSYYVGHEVQYPRYLCNDCHRPGYYSWWAGFDPYYSQCSVFHFRVNWQWGWGTPYWTGFVPHYVYVYRADCPPHYRLYGSQGVRHSSWDGWRRWTTMWGGPLRRYKNDPVPRTAYNPNRRWPKDVTPPGYITGGGRRWRGGTAPDPVARDQGGDRGARQPREIRDLDRRLAQRPVRMPRYTQRDPRQRTGDLIGRGRIGDVGRREPRIGDLRRSEPRLGDLGRRERRADGGEMREPRQTRDDGGRREASGGERREARQGRERRHFRSYDPGLQAPQVPTPWAGEWSTFDRPRSNEPAPSRPSVDQGMSGSGFMAPDRQPRHFVDVPRVQMPQPVARIDAPSPPSPAPQFQPQAPPQIRGDSRPPVSRGSTDLVPRLERIRRQ
jgi:hypothetical protein